MNKDKLNQVKDSGESNIPLGFTPAFEIYLVHKNTMLIRFYRV